MQYVLWVASIVVALLLCTVTSLDRYRCLLFRPASTSPYLPLYRAIGSVYTARTIQPVYTNYTFRVYELYNLCILQQSG